MIRWRATTTQPLTIETADDPEAFEAAVEGLLAETQRRAIRQWRRARRRTHTDRRPRR